MEILSYWPLYGNKVITLAGQPESVQKLLLQNGNEEFFFLSREYRQLKWNDLNWDLADP